MWLPWRGRHLTIRRQMVLRFTYRVRVLAARLRARKPACLVVGVVENEVEQVLEALVEAEDEGDHENDGAEDLRVVCARSVSSP